MARLSKPRAGSLQYWPRKRAAKVLPSANWKPIKGQGILGFIAYKVGMVSAVVKDNTSQSMTSGKKIFIPATILEVPNMKIYSVRFYKYNKVIKDIIVSTDKDLKRKLKLPKSPATLEKAPSDFDDIRLIVYPIVSQTAVKKTPDLIEIAFNAPEKLEFVKSLLNKEISFKEFKHDLIDIRALTKGKGLTGPVKRFGISLKAHKSEKGVRRPGSLGPWHPARVTFMAPQAGQMGFFSRIIYNLRILRASSISEKDVNPQSGFNNYGKIKTNYFIVKGSVQGPAKRQLLLTPAMRPTKSSSKKKYEFLELIK